MNIPANMTAKFSAVQSNEATFLEQIGMGGEASHIAAAILAVLAIKVMF